jgi:AAA family ATP:ADP antiporter
MNGERKLGPVERVLRLFTDIRAGEAPTALLLTLNIFLIFVAYSIMKVLREALVLGESGVDAKAASSAAQAILLLGAVPLYGAIASRVPRRRLINVVTSFFIACIGAFYALRVAGLPTGIAFYIWLGIFNVMVVAQFWGFANDVYTTDEGKRLFPVVAFGATSGAVVGAWLPRLLTFVGSSQLLIVAAALLLLSIVITNVVDARERRRTEAHLPDVNSTGIMPAATGQFRAATGQFKVPHEAYRRESGTFKAVPDTLEPEGDEPPRSTAGPFQLVLRNRYLLLIALLVMFLNWVNTSGENIVGAFFLDAANRAIESSEAGALDSVDLLADRFSSYQGTVNILAMLLQLFVVSRAIKYLGVSAALLVLPIISLAAYSFVLFVPLVAVVRWAKTAENSTDYSLNNTVRHALFLPTTREEKYKGKQAVDSFFQRAGDVLAAVTWFGGTMVLGFAYHQIALVNIVVVALWLIVAVLIGRRYRRLVATTD